MILEFALLLFLVGGGDTYRVRYDSPGMVCRVASSERAYCEAKRVYPATPKWWIMQDGKQVQEKDSLIIYFDLPEKQWVEVHMDVIQWDGDMVELALAIVRCNGNFRYIALTEETLVEPREIPQWAKDLPSYKYGDLNDDE